MSCKTRPTTLVIVLTQFDTGHIDMAWTTTNDGALTGDAVNTLIDPRASALKAVREELATAFGTWQHRMAVWAQLHPELIRR